MAFDWQTAITILDPIGYGPLVSGISDSSEAAKREKELGEAPKFEMPESLGQYQDLMKTRTRQEMPGLSQREAAIETGVAHGASAVGRMADTGWGAQGAIDALQEGARKDMRSLGIEALQYQRGTEEQYGQSLQAQAPYDVMQWERDEWMPWQIAKNEIAALRGAGQASAASGSDAMTAAAMQYMNMQQQQNYYNQQQQRYI